MGKKKTGKSTARGAAKLKGRKAKEFPPVAEALEKPLGEATEGTDATAAAPPDGKKPKRKPKAEKPRKVSALDAAAKVLGEQGEPMNCQEMIAAMAEKGYWKSANGQTPAATLYSALSREI